MQHTGALFRGIPVYFFFSLDWDVSLTRRRVWLRETVSASVIFQQHSVYVRTSLCGSLIKAQQWVLIKRIGLLWLIPCVTCNVFNSMNHRALYMHAKVFTPTRTHTLIINIILSQKTLCHSPTRGLDDLLRLHTITYTHDGECVFCQHHTLHTSGRHLTAINWVYYNPLMFTSHAEECYKYTLRQRAGEYFLSCMRFKASATMRHEVIAHASPTLWESLLNLHSRTPSIWCIQTRRSLNEDQPVMSGQNSFH